MSDRSDTERKVNCQCIANSNGVCKVKNCDGEIKRLMINDKDPDRAAWRYEISLKAFEDAFSEDFEKELERDVD